MCEMVVLKPKRKGKRNQRVPFIAYICKMSYRNSLPFFLYKKKTFDVCSLFGFMFEPCGCLYDDHWRLTWSLTSGFVGLVEVPDTNVKLKKKNICKI